MLAAHLFRKTSSGILTLSIMTLRYSDFFMSEIC